MNITDDMGNFEYLADLYAVDRTKSIAEQANDINEAITAKILNKVASVYNSSNIEITNELKQTTRHEGESPQDI